LPEFKTYLVRAAASAYDARRSSSAVIVRSPSRRIEIMNQKINRRMSSVALITVLLLGAGVLTFAAQRNDDEAKFVPQDSKDDPAPPASREAAAAQPRPATDIRDLEARIARLERLVEELSQALQGSAADSGRRGAVNRDTTAVRESARDVESRHAEAAARVAEVERDRIVAANRQRPGTVPDESVARARFAAAAANAARERLVNDGGLKETLMALDKLAWDAASRGDWKAYEKLLRPQYHWGYFGTSRDAPTVADLQRRRYFDVQIREVDAGKISDDVAFLTYRYSCKVEEAGQVQTYRDRQSMQIWTQIDGAWLLTYTTNFVLKGGE
jgi:hypothetical protein